MYAFDQMAFERERARIANGASSAREFAGDGAPDPPEPTMRNDDEPASHVGADEPPLFTRPLLLQDTRDIKLRLWRPTRVVRYGCEGFKIGFMLAGLDYPQQFAFSDDAFQALLIAITALDGYFDPHRAALTWFGLPYPDPAFADLLDAGRQRQMHAIVEEEIFAIAERRRMQREMCEAQAAAESAGETFEHPS